METLAKTVWAIDPTHSEVGFRIKHLVISTVKGKFETFEGSVETEEDQWEEANIEFSAKIDSINTGTKDRDAHLKSDDFFNAESFPELKFKSTSLRKIAEGKFELTGDLTIRDITKPIKLNVEYGGTVVDPYGNTKAGFEVSGKINRKEFGLKWDAVTEAGSIVVSDDVQLDLNVQLIKQ